MAKRNASDEVKRFEHDYLQEDTKTLERELPNYKQKSISGALVSSFGQWLCYKQICSINEHGLMVVHDPVAYTRWSKADAKLSWQRYFEIERDMQLRPEERQRWSEKMAAIFGKMKQAARKITV